MDSQIREFTFNIGLKPINFIPEPFIKAELDEVNDNQLVFQSMFSDDGLKYSHLFQISLETDSLNLIKIDTLWNESIEPVFKNSINGLGVFPISKKIKDPSRNDSVWFRSHTSPDSNLIVEVYNHFPSASNRNNAYLTKVISNRILTNLPIYLDSSLFFYAFNFSTDSAFIYELDLSSSILRSNFFTDKSANDLKFSFRLAYGPIDIDSENDTSIFLPISSSADIVLLSKKTLDTSGYFQLNQSSSNELFNSYNVIELSATYSLMKLDTITQLGVATIVNGLFDIYNRYYKMKTNINGSLIEFKLMGQDSSENNSFSGKRINHIDYLVGTKPHRNQNFFIDQRRNITIYRTSDIAIDSVIVFGKKNHFGTDILADKVGDCYLLSLYSNAWTDDSAYVSVIKIPSFLFIGINEFSIKTKSLKAYPNPTQSILYFEEDLLNTQYLILNSQGKTFESGLVKQSYIDIENLERGYYLIQFIAPHSNELIGTTKFIKL